MSNGSASEPWITPGGQGVLAVHRLGKGYRGRMVVQDVSLSVRRGEAVGLLGPNGAGKTTVFYMITGLVKPDKGEIELDGHDVTGLPMFQRARLGVGYLPQEASIFRGLNVEDNIRAVLEVNEPNRRAREAMLESLLEEFDIARVRSAPSISLVGRRTATVRDRPRPRRQAVFHAARRAFRGHRPDRGRRHSGSRAPPQRARHRRLITDHNVRETLGLIDRAYIIHSGQVLTEGPPDDIIAHPDVRRFYLGEDFRM